LASDYAPHLLMMQGVSLGYGKPSFSKLALEMCWTYSRGSHRTNESSREEKIPWS